MSSNEFKKMRNCQIEIETMQNKREPQIVTRAHQNSRELSRFVFRFVDSEMSFE
jgi:hypothetical protein